MKKSLLFSLLIFALTGCSEKEQFEQAVLKDMQKEQDIKDYKIDPENITECVVDTITGTMPGFFFADPQRLEAYVLYTKMLSLSEAEDPEKTLKELQTAFGSGRELSQARGDYSQSVFDCIATMLMKYGDPEPKRAISSTKEPEIIPEAEPKMLSPEPATGIE